MNKQTDGMSTAVSADQPTASRDWGDSRGWPLFSVIIGRPPPRLLMKREWPGGENFPPAGGVILAPSYP